jgi:hypothetical protein
MERITKQRPGKSREKMSRETGKSAASRASHVLRGPTATAKEKSAAASTLTQRKTQLEMTSARVAQEASAVLRNPSANPAAKSAAASALSQRAKGK